MSSSFVVLVVIVAVAVAIVVYKSRSQQRSQLKAEDSANRQAEMSAFVQDFLTRFPAEFATAELRAKAYDDDLLRCYARAARRSFLSTRDENNRDLPIGFPHFCAVEEQKNLELMIKRLNTLDSNLVSDEILAQATEAAAKA